MNADPRRQMLLARLEDQFRPHGVVGYWGSTTDPDEGSRIEILRFLNVPTDSLIAVDRAAYDAAYELFAFDWNFLIDVRDRREVEIGGCYAAEFQRIAAQRLCQQRIKWTDLTFALSGRVTYYSNYTLDSVARCMATLTTSSNQFVYAPRHTDLLLNGSMALHRWIASLRSDADTSTKLYSEKTKNSWVFHFQDDASRVQAANTHYSLAA